MVDVIPMLDLARQHDEYQEKLTEAFKRTLKHGQFIMGDEVASFEHHLSQWLSGMEVVSVSSGTDALLVSLMALDVQPGDEVIVPAFTFFATAGVVARLGAVPRFADIDEHTFNLSVESIQSALTPNTKVIIPVHLFGQMAPVSEIASACPEHVTLLEDAAQSLGASRHGLSLSPNAIASTTSFFPTKNLGGMGDGGAVFSANSTFVDRLKMLRVHGAKPKYTHYAIGGNFRLDAMQACLLDIKLKYLSSTLTQRKQLAATYSMLFAESGLVKEGVLRLPETLDGNVHSFNQFVIRVSRRDALKEYLSRNGIQSMIYYPSPLHPQPCFRHLGYQNGDFPVAEQACREVLAIPCFPGMTLKEQRRVVMSIRSFYEG